MYKSFKDIPVRKDSFDLADKIYNLINNFSKTELYALTDHLKRSSVSVSAYSFESFGRYYIHLDPP
ncbi:MAG: rRNA-intervening sequence protein [Clostridiales bacterium]|jgi:four helix bundle protein|nr:rRNA-intervening sequence protein [Clostridiales bacterium]MDK2934509.1 rRNA-intervening sequence protein [Clostridiales bacterium]